jgi:hypothetical protein
MIELYFWPTPNGHKITMFLEEARLHYTIHPVDISAGDQFKPGFLVFSPNNRMPAIVNTTPAAAEPRLFPESPPLVQRSAEAPRHAARLCHGRAIRQSTRRHRRGKKILFGQTAQVVQPGV